MSVSIRAEEAGDAQAISHLLTEAFEGPAEALIVERLRESCPETLSLVAVDGPVIVGHILFSPAAIDGVRGMGLAPMAVAPSRQREGIGSALATEGVERLRGADCAFVIVLGHPAYYPRFGFTPASERGILCEWDVPDEAFMILVLDEEAMRGVVGTARYRPELTLS